MSVPRNSTLIRTPKTAELIAAHLRAPIVRGEMQEGDALPSEAELMIQFGVSRPTLREAFRILEAESLISVRRGSRGGARVMQPDPSVAARYVGLLLQVQGTTIVDVYNARVAIEPPCVRMLAERATEQDVADLRQCISELADVVEAGQQQVPDPVRWSQLTYRFHELMMDRCGNQTLAVLGGMSSAVVRKHLAVEVSRTFHASTTRSRFRTTIKSYSNLVDLIEAHDPEGAEQHWRTHMEAARKYLLGPELRTKPVVDLFS